MAQEPSKKNDIGDAGQTAVEYILIIAGAILFIILVILVVRGSVFAPSQNTIRNVSQPINSLIRNITN